MRNLVIAASLFTLTAAEAQNAAKPPDWWPSQLPWVQVTTEFEAWRACVAGKAGRFSKGPDAAELIVQAAQIACEDEKSRFAQQLDKLDRPKLPVALPGTYESQEVTKAREAIYREALLRVIELRAAK
jgi:hypothetical protein